MKKIISAFFLALFAIHAGATKPSKLPAIVIDTLYHASGVLIVEYELIRPFEQVNLSVQSSWRTALKERMNDRQSWILSGKSLMFNFKVLV